MSHHAVPAADELQPWQCLAVCLLLMKYSHGSACQCACMPVSLAASQLLQVVDGLAGIDAAAGPRIYVFNLGFQACAYASSATLPLLLMLLRPNLYHRWRLQLCLLNRLLRLFNSTLQLTSTTALELIAKAMAARTQAESPSKALAINLLHPAGWLPATAGTFMTKLL
jgi:hypothetical protein